MAVKSQWCRHAWYLPLDASDEYKLLKVLFTDRIKTARYLYNCTLWVILLANHVGKLFHFLRGLGWRCIKEKAVIFERYRSDLMIFIFWKDRIACPRLDVERHSNEWTATLINQISYNLKVDRNHFSCMGFREWCHLCC